MGILSIQTTLHLLLLKVVRVRAISSGLDWGHRNSGEILFQPCTDSATLGFYLFCLIFSPGKMGITVACILGNSWEKSFKTVLGPLSYSINVIGHNYHHHLSHHNHHYCLYHQHNIAVTIINATVITSSNHDHYHHHPHHHHHHCYHHCPSRHHITVTVTTTMTMTIIITILIILVLFITSQSPSSQSS